MNNVWDQMVVFNQLTLHKIFFRKEYLGTPIMRAVIATLTSEQRDNTIFFLDCSIEELAGLNDGQCTQAMVYVHNFLDFLPTVDPNTGGSN